MKYNFVLMMLSFTSLAFGQFSGKVTYEEKMDLHRNLPPERQEMKDMMPHYNTAVFDLTYAGDESIYQPQKESEQTEVTSNMGGAQMTMKFGRENRVVYKNLSTAKMIESREFMQKQFLITGPPTERKWKIGKGQKEILGHKCMEASARIDSATTLVAWFAPDIQVSNGPGDYQGLPGLILGIDVNDGLRTVTAISMKTDDVETSVIVAPTKGKEVTSAEFEKIRDEKMKEMHIQQEGGGAQQIIMIRH
jgi:GLPGLI family protein